jgi:hypothetical protein
MKAILHDVLTSTFLANLEPGVEAATISPILSVSPLSQRLAGNLMSRPRTHKYGLNPDLLASVFLALLHSMTAVLTASLPEIWVSWTTLVNMLFQTPSCLSTLPTCHALARAAESSRTPSCSR